MAWNIGYAKGRSKIRSSFQKARTRANLIIINSGRSTSTVGAQATGSETVAKDKENISPTEENVSYNPMARQSILIYL